MENEKTRHGNDLLQSFADQVKALQDENGSPRMRTLLKPSLPLDGHWRYVENPNLRSWYSSTIVLESKISAPPLPSGYEPLPMIHGGETSINWVGSIRPRPDWWWATDSYRPQSGYAQEIF